jgi:acyl-CoA synthetase (NDP forming)
MMSSSGVDLGTFFNPASVAVVGVSRKVGAFGGALFLRKYRESGFKGALYPIHPEAGEIDGVRAYPSLSSLPEVPELVIVAVKADLVLSVLEDCARIGTRHIHIFTSGFSEIGTREGADLERRVAAIAREKGLLVIGPNCMGPYCPSSRLTAWGAVPGMPGPVGVISQSGGLTQRLTEYLYSLGIGTEKAVSMGNATVLGAPDYLELMARDDRIRVIGMYLESIRDGRRLLRLAREVGRKKPIVIWKGGVSDAGARTVASHTGSMAGERRLWDALFRQSGAVRAGSMNDWADALLALSLLPAPRGKGVFLIGGGGGSSVANGDTCVEYGLEVPRLSEQSMERLRETVPVAGSIAGNPLDAWRIFDDSEYLLEILRLAYADPNVSMVIVDRMVPRAAFHMTGDASLPQEVADFVVKSQKPTVFTIDCDGGDADLAARGTALRAEICRAGIPAYPSLRRAAWALARLHAHHVHRAAAA